MPRIAKVLRLHNKGQYALVEVQLEDGDESYFVFVGGSVEAYHDKGVNKAFIKRPKQGKEK